jgi:FtsP/CotA-like multicopper oxidase with cupredoxin domain
VYLYPRCVSVFLGALVAIVCGSFVPQVALAAEGGRTRTYYVAADEVVWDYAPTGTNLSEGRPFNDIERPWMEPGPHVTGRKAKKALYREYTDDTFSTLAPRASEWEHLGFLGPLIRAEVGDTIVVVFRNNTKFPASVHPHGVFYNKDSEGAHYADGTSDADRADDGVPPGGTHRYVWPVPERAGPTEHEGSSAFWMYHSHHDEIRDVASGLIGPLIVTRKGMAHPDGSPTDVDREIVVGFIEVDENSSWYVEENIATYATDPKGVRVGRSAFGDLAVLPAGPPPAPAAPPKPGEISLGPPFGAYFKETINGYSYGHTPGVTMRVGQRVRWYAMGSTNFEFHTPHWHGNVVTANHMRTDVGMLLPMGMFVADMVPDNPGKWFFHCHVAAHLRMGMQAFYTVEGIVPATSR